MEVLGLKNRLSLQDRISRKRGVAKSTADSDADLSPSYIRRTGAQEKPKDDANSSWQEQGYRVNFKSKAQVRQSNGQLREINSAISSLNMMDETMQLLDQYAAGAAQRPEVEMLTTEYNQQQLVLADVLRETPVALQSLFAQREMFLVEWRDGDDLHLVIDQTRSGVTNSRALIQDVRGTLQSYALDLVTERHPGLLRRDEQTEKEFEMLQFAHALKGDILESGLAALEAQSDPNRELVTELLG